MAGWSGGKITTQAAGKGRKLVVKSGGRKEWFPKGVSQKAKITRDSCFIPSHKHRRATPRRSRQLNNNWDGWEGEKKEQQSGIGKYSEPGVVNDAHKWGVCQSAHLHENFTLSKGGTIVRGGGDTGGWETLTKRKKKHVLGGDPHTWLKTIK